MSSRWLTTLGVALVICVLTYFVSRKLGFTLLLLPLCFFWGSRSDDQ